MLKIFNRGLLFFITFESNCIRDVVMICLKIKTTCRLAMRLDFSVIFVILTFDFSL